MRTKFESLPNEILLIILANLSSLELLTSLWSLNKRIDVLICSILSRVDNRLNSGLLIIEPGLSFNECHSLLFHSVSTLNFCIQRIHFDGANSIASDLSYELLFDNDKNILRFPNLKSLVLTRCFLIESLIKSLPLLVKHQLNELVLTFHENVLKPLPKCNVISFRNVRTEKILIKFDELIRHLFSNECRLTSLRLDFASKHNDIDHLQCLKPHDNLSSGSMIADKYKFCCSTLRRLHIHITHTCFFEHLIDYVPALEQLFVFSEHSSNIKRQLTAGINIFVQTNDNWVNKVPKLESFTLKTSVENDIEFTYLKWILNNLNHIKKLKIHLTSDGAYGTDATIWKSVVDANFIRRYCLPDKAFDELRKDALNTVQYAEFKIPGCHRDSNELIRIGKNLVPFLSTYMAHLQTLCLWRPDDFPWTSIRPDYKRGYYYGGLIRRRYDKLQTPESIKKHVIIFEEDLCELVEQMKDLIFLDIHGEIHEEKVEPYRSVVQAIFPYNRSDIEMFRFRLWL
ncbi:unnamed protein product [Rotaria socialis]|uniref:F-box domain-containing protein n=1 Tax=Rotaria socialis TaxID=392032 RepID=A0A817SDR3_9BILA|nr:unnamed protein product [Rotaria socialis]CAF4179687.1 unnamed protein product [Rotaria socialis]